MNLESKHYIAIGALAIVIIMLLRSEGFLGAALSPEQKNLCTSTGGNVTSIILGSKTVTLSSDYWTDFVLTEGNYNAQEFFSSLGTKIKEIDVFDCPTQTWKLFDPITGGDILWVNETTGRIVQIKTTEPVSFTSDKIIESGSCKGSRTTNDSCVFAQFFDASAGCPLPPSGINNYCTCPQGKSWVYTTGCIASADVDKTLCTSTGGTWDDMLRKCSCLPQNKFKAEIGCEICMPKETYKLSDFCTASETLCLFADEQLPSSYFSSKLDCEASMECKTSNDCTKTAAAFNDCSAFWRPHDIEQAGTCSMGKCSYVVESPPVCTANEIWWQDNVKWVIAGFLAIILIIYLIWERGPKRGFFRK